MQKFWTTSDNHYLFNPRDPDCNTDQLKEIGITSHIWIKTSGSTGSSKWVAISKESFLSSAKAVNYHLQCVEEDIWVNPLPLFHVGGLSIFARAYIGGYQAINTWCETVKWDPVSFNQVLFKEKATITSLVPTQVYDIVQKKIRAPDSLRVVIVGGGVLSDVLISKARKLKWPIVPSYGLTECASQVATGLINDSNSGLLPLAHLKLKIDSKKRISLKGKALFTGYALFNNDKMQFVDPKIDGWFLTEDLGELREGVLTLFGRNCDWIKIGGELVNLLHLQQTLEEILLKYNRELSAQLIPYPDKRLGSVIHLAIEKKELEHLHHIVEQFNLKVLPFERIRHIKPVDFLPRTTIGKLKTYKFKNSDQTV